MTSYGDRMTYDDLEGVRKLANVIAAARAVVAAYYHVPEVDEPGLHSGMEVLATALAALEPDDG